MARSGIAPLKPAEYIKLMTRWGFELEKGSGGHWVMSFDDRRVQITAPRRKAVVPYKALREAADVLGVDLQEFLAGPTKKEKYAVVIPDEIRVTQPCGCVIDEHGWTPCDEHTEKPVEVERETEVVAEDEDVPTTRRRRRQTRTHTPIVEVVGMRTRKRAPASAGSGVEMPEDLDLTDMDVEVEKVVPAPRPVKVDEAKEEVPVSVDRRVQADRIVNRIVTEAGIEIGTPLQKSAYNAAVASITMLLHTVEND